MSSESKRKNALVKGEAENGFAHEGARKLEDVSARKLESVSARNSQHHLSKNVPSTKSSVQGSAPFAFLEVVPSSHPSIQLDISHMSDQAPNQTAALPLSSTLPSGDFSSLSPSFRLPAQQLLASHSLALQQQLQKQKVQEEQLVLPHRQHNQQLSQPQWLTNPMNANANASLARSGVLGTSSGVGTGKSHPAEWTAAAQSPASASLSVYGGVPVQNNMHAQPALGMPLQPQHQFSVPAASPRAGLLASGSTAMNMFPPSTSSFLQGHTARPYMGSLAPPSFRTFSGDQHNLTTSSTRYSIEQSLPSHSSVPMQHRYVNSFHAEQPASMIGCGATVNLENPSYGGVNGLLSSMDADVMAAVLGADSQADFNALMTVNGLSGEGEGVNPDLLSNPNLYL